MPIDETILNSTILDLINKINENTTQRQKLRQLHLSAQRIKLIDVPDPIPEDTERTKKEMPMDSVLGTVITEERRQAIYDTLMADYAKLE